MSEFRFIGGPFDGATILVGDRAPDQIDLQLPCLPHEPFNSDHGTLIDANVQGRDLEEAIFRPNAESCTYRYSHEMDNDGNEWFAFRECSVRLMPGASWPALPSAKF